MSLKITILGCGNSSGVPVMGDAWGNCDPNEPRNIRSRCCLAVQSGKTTILVDTSADIRQQINKFNITSLDAVFYTHQHSDHCHGIDDLRPFYFRNNKSRINCYASLDTMNEIKIRFHYLFDGGVNRGIYPPLLNGFAFEDKDYGSKLMLGDIEYTPFEMDHGTCISTGYRFGDISYCVDMKSLNDKALDIIKGSKIWIVDGCGYHNPDNLVHADLERLYKYNEFIGADKVYVTSLSSFMDYKTLEQELLSGFYPAYDGLSFEIK